jgi:hypothetical protein
LKSNRTGFNFSSFNFSKSGSKHFLRIEGREKHIEGKKEETHLSKN